MRGRKKTIWVSTRNSSLRASWQGAQTTVTLEKDRWIIDLLLHLSVDASGRYVALESIQSKLAELEDTYDVKLVGRLGEERDNAAKRAKVKTKQARSGDAALEILRKAIDLRTVGPADDPVTVLGFSFSKVCHGSASFQRASEPIDVRRLLAERFVEREAARFESLLNDLSKRNGTGVPRRVLLSDRSRDGEHGWPTLSKSERAYMTRYGLYGDGGPRYRVGWLEAEEALPVLSDLAEARIQRVMPYVDEAAILYRAVRDLNPPGSILNMYGRAGALSLALHKRWPQAKIVMTSVNPRAITLAKINHAIHGARNISRVPIDDPKLPIPPPLKYDLVVLEPPFAHQPPQFEEHDHSFGGEWGLQAIRPIMRQIHALVRVGGRAVFAAYTLGTPKEPIILRWALENDLNGGRAFKQVGRSWRWDGGRIDWRWTPGNMWRSEGKKVVPENPMPVEWMCLRLRDPEYQVRCVSGDHASTSYVEWIMSLKTGQYKFDQRTSIPLTHLHHLTVTFQPR